MKTLAFTKSFQGISPQQGFKQIKELGFDELELTVRKGGHVDPENLERDFNTAEQAWEQAGIKPGVFTTGIISPESTNAEKIIAFAEKYNVHFIRMGLPMYSFGRLKQDLVKWHKGILELLPMAEKHNVSLLIHVHSANYLSALPFHWIPLFEKTKSPALGLYVDPCHHHIEGGLQGWLMALEMAKDVIRMVAVKDYRWHVPYKKEKEGFAYPLFTTLEKGLTPWNQVIRVLKIFGFDGPFSFHGEYSDASRHNVPQGLRSDLQYFKNLLASYKPGPFDFHKEMHYPEDP